LLGEKFALHHDFAGGVAAVFSKTAAIEFDICILCVVGEERVKKRHT
jgi:hypothetical protein